MHVANTNSNKQYHTIIGVVIHNYPLLILNFKISSFVDKVFHYSGIASFSSYMQGSLLIERKKRLQLSQKSTFKQVWWKCKDSCESVLVLIFLVSFCN